MEHAHYRILMLERTGFHNGVCQYFYQSASGGIDDHTDQYSGQRSREEIRDKSQPYKADDTCNFGSYYTAPVTDRVYEPGAEEIYEQLRQKECNRDQSYFAKGNIVVRMKFNEQERDEIRGYCLCDEGQIAGRQSLSVILFHNAFTFIIFRAIPRGTVF